MNTPLPASVVACVSGAWMGVEEYWVLEFGGRILESEGLEEQKDHLEGWESTGCGIDTDSRTDVGEKTGRDGKESAASTRPVGARRDAFI